ncbi:MAG: type III secretion system chaperone [Sphingomonadales bacterium]
MALQNRRRSIITSLVIGAMLASSPLPAQEAEPGGSENGDSERTVMTVEHLGELVRRIDADAEGKDGLWQLQIKNYPVTVITDQENDRMRIVVPIARLDNVSAKVLKRVMQANFDSALDARYAVAQDILWSTYIHPLGSLQDEEFLAGLGQTVNLVVTFGSTYSSGVLFYGGGDSQGILERQLIDELIKRGKAA